MESRASQAEQAWAHKAALIAEVKSLTAMLSTDFQTASERMLAVQEQWAAIGRSGSDAVEDELWKQFRAAHQGFYAAGNTPKAQGRSQAETRQQKLRIVDEAERISHSVEWVSTELVFQRLDEEWRKTRPLGSAEEAQLVERLKQAWGRFARARAAHFADQRRKTEEALHAKESLVHEAAALIKSTDLNEVKQKFSELETRWKSATAVPPLDEQRLWTSMQQTQAQVIAAIEQELQRREEERRRREEEKRAIYQHKETLIKQTLDLLHSPDFQTAEEGLQQLVTAWNSSGYAGQEHEQGLYERFTQAAGQVYQAIEDAAEESRREAARRLVDEMYDLRDEADELDHRIYEAKVRLSDMMARQESSRNDPWELTESRAEAIEAESKLIDALRDRLEETMDDIAELETRLRNVG
ncbi:hypothetical protein Rhe02_17910 [Rhizocola hellebori]|uniref:DUF349 domain-containing protein n=1 Tax=Rhizocola hellebori TaxID=1392758 RepID=A0A8J3Q5D6_9ACTN|nr:DUF349 domain-containing protein [Rhizocola hellebori]GIH03724.1 hypothetical protein Rhe02_17910 [Rhizocola hellebori]